MGELWVTWNKGEANEVTLPFSQAVNVLRCLERLRERTGREVTWHRSDCECCVVVHVKPKGDEHITDGYIISPSGLDWVTTDLEGHITWHGDDINIGE